MTNIEEYTQKVIEGIEDVDHLEWFINGPAGYRESRLGREYPNLAQIAFESLNINAVDIQSAHSAIQKIYDDHTLNMAIDWPNLIPELDPNNPPPNLNVITTENGLKALSGTSTSATNIYDITIENEGTINFGVNVHEWGPTATLAVRQFPESGSEISRFDVTTEIVLLGATLANPIRFDKTITLDPLCKRIIIQVDPNGSTTTIGGMYLRRYGKSFTPSDLSRIFLKYDEYTTSLYANKTLPNLFKWEFSNLESGLPVLELVNNVVNTEIEATFQAGQYQKLFVGLSLLNNDDTSSRMLIIQYDASGSQIRDLGDGNGDYRFEPFIPAGDYTTKPLLLEYERPIAPLCTRIVMYLNAPDSASMKVALPYLREIKGFNPNTDTSNVSEDILETQYIDIGGNDANPGSELEPKSTLMGVFDSGAKEAFIKPAVYDENQLFFNAANLKGSYKIKALNDTSTVIVRGGEILTDFTITAGQTGIFQKDLATAPVAYSSTKQEGFLWIIDEPFSSISSEERSAYHRGRTHRSPHYQLEPYANLAALAAVDDGFCWDSGIVYIKPPASVTGTTMEVAVPRSRHITGGHEGVEISIEDVQYEFAGLIIDNFKNYNFKGIFAIGSPLDLLSLDQTSGVDKDCYLIGANNDNWNMHNSLPSVKRTTTLSIGPYGALAWDDGRSIHELCGGTVLGGLFEKNGSMGVAVASGADEVLFGTIARTNGKHNPDEGQIGVLTPVLEGAGSTLVCHGVIAEDGETGFGCKDDDNNKIVLYNSKAIGITGVGYRNQQGTIETYDCTFEGTGTPEAGVVTKKNSTLLA